MALRSIPPYTRLPQRVRRRGEGTRTAAERVGSYLTSPVQTRGRASPIAPRLPWSPLHTVKETVNGYHVSITFPLHIVPSDVRWGVVGDVLEVEYIGQHCAYYHNFLVPTEFAPSVQYTSSAVEFLFPKGHQDGVKRDEQSRGSSG